jgi:hypothetical protein
MYYFVTNMFLGAGRHLDTYGDAANDGGTANDPFMDTATGFSGQNWEITALGGGSYRLSNMFLGDARALATVPDGSKLIMATTADDPAQQWQIAALNNGYYRVTSVLLGQARSLDTKNDMINEPFMGVTGDLSGQYWQFTKAP